MAAPVRRRTRARELAMQFLYTLDLCGPEAFAGLDPFVDHHTRRDPDRKGQEEIAGYAKALVTGVHEHLDDLNRWIERIASNWRLERMAVIDRNVLRMAIYELLHQPDVPFKVVINEAIDIAKRYSTTQSGAFVNGILDAARLRIEEQRDRGVAEPKPPEAPRQTAEGGADSESTKLKRSLPPSDAPVPTPRPRSTRSRLPKEG